LELTGMTNDYLEKRYTCIYRSIEKGCLDCRSQRPCPSLIVIAMRYAREIATDCADGVVSAAIREAHCPVMTVPSHFSG
jgi:hypothetical protein